MGMLDQLRTFAKKSRALHSAYKMTRDIRTIPPKKFLRPDQLADIFRILPNTMVTLPRLFDAHDIVAKVNRERVPGDIVECGVWNGGCAALMGLADQNGRTIHLFDSFEGLPQLTEEDSPLIAKYGATSQQFRNGEPLKPIDACVGEKADEVEKFIRGVGLTNYVFHVGWFQDTLPVAAIDRIAVLRLDGDWYESTKVCLDHLYDKVSVGGYVIFDDYGDFEGCKRAVDEFLGSRYLHPTLTFSDENCCYFRKAA